MSEEDRGERNTGAGGSTGSESGATTGAGGTTGGEDTGAAFDAPVNPGSGAAEETGEDTGAAFDAPVV